MLERCLRAYTLNGNAFVVYTRIAVCCGTSHIAVMEISLDPAKREKTLRERSLDFVDAGEVFDATTYRWVDDRFDYGEVRTVSIAGCVVAWSSSSGRNEAPRDT